ncbi:glycosyltransferase family 1 protein [Cyanobium sp. Aljojuca 7D2]|uniref:CgeB family protein n=1 Tax=Cyanobium sp. Aljojuca 7D2 TaxID=2823698 RepID=UPI0020CCC63E|nr:glycosyltransferase [Cyanobium sp. Aljojuca 7D2]MCP9890265.1 glycosyltransferase family 1 protein [Cyanobium sp. Aljojuca 7D2]
MGCDAVILNPSVLIGPRNPLLAYIDYRTGFRFVQRHLLNSLSLELLSLQLQPDLIWINGGELIGKSILAWLRRKFSCKIVLYNNDDPTHSRDGRRFAALRKTFPLYDLCVLCRSETSLESQALGSRKSLRVWMSYDEILHVKPQHTSLETSNNLVSFVGTLIPGESRDRFLMKLLCAGLPLSIIGDRWIRSPFFKTLNAYYEGLSVSGDRYSLALAAPAVSLGLLSHGNRDLSTQRSFETPACGGLFCAERTSEHQLLFEDGVEAVFWDSADECIAACKDLLADPLRNQAIRKAGEDYIHIGGYGNEDVCLQILNSI